MIQIWLLRSAVAVLLVFGSEIVLWNDPQSRTVVDWGLLALGYVALSAVVLDLGVRYRVRDVFGLIVLTGIYGLLNGAILNPQTGLLEVPRTLVTRVLGAHTLIGLLLLALWVALRQRPTRNQIISVGICGVLWGVWVRWLPLLADTISAEVPLSVLVIYAVVPLIGLTALLPLVKTPPQRLTTPEWAVAGAVLAVIFARNSLPNLDVFALTIVVVLVGFCGLLLWFQKRDKGSTSFENAIDTSARSLAVLDVVFIAAGIGGYLLPLGDVPEVLAPYVALFTAFGVVWLPTVSLILGVRAYRRLTRQMRL